MSEVVKENIDILNLRLRLMRLFEPIYHKWFVKPYKLDRTTTGSGILVYVRDDIPSKLLKISCLAETTECLSIEVNLCKTKWLFMY